MVYIHREMCISSLPRDIILQDSEGGKGKTKGKREQKIFLQQQKSTQPTPP